MTKATGQVHQQIEALYRSESRRVFATLLRLLGDFQLADEALQDAFTAALKQWPLDGVPANPRAWLVSTGRFKAIDGLRRQSRFVQGIDEFADQLEVDTPDFVAYADEDIEDDRLRLIFTCCHPALAEESRVALTLREVCGLTTEEIASAFLSRPTTIAQRIVRAKAKIRDANIPYQIPSAAELPERMSAVLQVLYLMYNEGYSASSGANVTRADVSTEAIRLAELLLDLNRDSNADTEIAGLLALMLLQESRRAARSDAQGELVLMADQDRRLWNRDYIDKGVVLVRRALKDGRFGPYSIQAAIAAIHAESVSAETTDWAEIVGLYDVLLRVNASPVIALNRAVALGMRDGPAAGAMAVDEIYERGDLADYHLLHAARADFNRQLGQYQAALVAYQAALGYAQQMPEIRFLEKRIAEMRAKLTK
ncbi:RNA polymerase sigma factor [Zhongshania aliphaticivorans]|uniref:RNA polymerase sigma factor n=1 Tax=Zhongshania aliphaticivorans TaxID=1470434 RepID=UPI0012E5DEEA|nr:RNA polymerase sigma factor [Zhongshania aliphaticivorans]CAA0111601.1 putative ECF RNA polymerase sigma factor SigI [Zhongshania aliphaticivorans]